MKDTELVKQKIDVVELVGEYVQLKPSGINHKGLCPFHQEKSPSFMVNRERQSWHCFGCNKGGDIFSFVQEIEGLDFVEALKMLAQKAGIQLTNTFEDKEASSQKNRIKDINAKATAFYHHVLLNTDASKDAQAYLEKRGLTHETIVDWQIGFIPDQWDLLTSYLLKKGYSIDDLVASGLTIKKDGATAGNGKGFYDRFRGRIMFPIWDVHGNVVGFTGRVLVETEKSGGKYVNTPQTSVYDKSRVVFGLNKAKQDIRKKDVVVMVEGQMDVIACHQAGMKNVVATSGTALTSEQIILLKRYSSNMNMAFDADDAGIHAVDRGIDLAVVQGMHIKVIEIPEGKGKDPDECLKANPDIWFDAVKNASPVMNWRFSRAFAGKNLSDPIEKQKIVDKLLPKIVIISYAVERDHWLQQLASRVGVDTSILREDMKRVEQKGPHVQVAPSSSAPAKPVAKKTFSRSEQLFEQYLMAILASGDGSTLEQVQEDRFPQIKEMSLYPLYEKLKVQYTTDRSLHTDALREFFVNSEGENILDVLSLKAGLALSDLDANALKKESEETLFSFHDTLRQIRLSSLELSLRQAEAEKDHDKMNELIQEVQALNTTV
ncbi:MAG: DNA primase [Candidatus Magasanikbacteria bacterium CG_4_10_14_0_2_um_filter_41_10]|uniref:DNA primase n=1 Tax=Candidatus Magasanikbacteria bacterium CG_4_10_14_0_2_um_filter_41_10 TaxID=1974638 RepID=A0A2M7V204_9BACT|nr:MAG: DNA primase [Candidatus Magasanikbacteria bacterium CG_4_10_14_0_2_um_filter_41_10]